MASNASDVQIKKIMDNAPPEFLAKIMALYEKTNKEQIGPEENTIRFGALS